MRAVTTGYNWDMKDRWMDRKGMRIALIALGSLLMVAAYAYFFTPHRIAPGGFSGIGMVLYHKLGWPVGAVTMAMNLPLYIVAFRREGLRFILLSVLATVLFSVLVDLLPSAPLTDDVLMSSVFGGALLGVGLGLVLRAGATTGGTDMLAWLIGGFIPSARIGMILLIIECTVVGLSAIAFGVEAALYATISLLISTRLVDVLQEGVGAAKAFYIISSNPDAIGKSILERMGRGATELYGRGVYTGKEQRVLLCVIHRSETSLLKDLVHQVDPHAFLFISDAREAMGRGFATLKESRADAIKGGK